MILNGDANTSTDVIKFPAIQKSDGSILFDPAFKTMTYTQLTEFASFLNGSIVETQWTATYTYDRIACNRKGCFKAPGPKGGLCDDHNRSRS